MHSYSPMALSRVTQGLLLTFHADSILLLTAAVAALAGITATAGITSASPGPQLR
jgi:hypothetical protein